MASVAKLKSIETAIAEARKHLNGLIKVAEDEGIRCDISLSKRRVIGGVDDFPLINISCTVDLSDLDCSEES